MILLIASIFPVIVLLYLVYRKDQEKEPLSLLLKCLWGGVLSIFVSLLMSLPLSIFEGFFPKGILSSFYQAFFEAAIPEEIAKFLMLYFFVWKRKEFNHHFDGIVYAVFVSLGFALIENIIYVFENGLAVAFFRAILAVPGHGLDGVLMGYYFSLARFHEGKEKKEYLFKAIALPVILHGAYDFLLFYMSSTNNMALAALLFIVFTLLVIFLWKKGLSRIRQHLEKDRLFFE